MGSARLRSRAEIETYLMTHLLSTPYPAFDGGTCQRRYERTLEQNENDKNRQNDECAASHDLPLHRVELEEASYTDTRGPHRPLLDDRERLRVGVPRRQHRDDNDCGEGRTR